MPSTAHAFCQLHKKPVPIVAIVPLSAAHHDIPRCMQGCVRGDVIYLPDPPGASPCAAQFDSCSFVLIRKEVPLG